MPTHLVDPIPQHSTVAVLGYGASGRAATRLLRALGKSVIVSDKAGTPDTDDPHVRFVFGTNTVEDATLAILSPGLNPEWPENRDNPALAPIWAAMHAGTLTVMSEVELGLRAFHRPYIAIGGTDGKSTTAALTHHLAKAFGYTSVLGGNSWRAFCDVAMDADPASDLAIVEISAFQLHRPHGIHPAVAITTNIAADHLDHYEDFDAYVAAKSALFENQGPGDSAILCEGDERLHVLGEALKSRGVRVGTFGNSAPDERWGGFVAGEHDGEVIVQVDDDRYYLPFDVLMIAGAHNRRNFMAAMLALLALEPRDPDVPMLLEAVATFHGLPHRVSFVRELDGVRYFNDSKATNVHAACVGIRSMVRPTVAIIGGVDKRLPLDALWPALADHAHTVIAMGELQERLAAEAPAGLRVVCADSMDDAVAQARAAARSGDAVLLAPASSSFDMFKSFEHRGDVFEACVRALVEA